MSQKVLDYSSVPLILKDPLKYRTLKVNVYEDEFTCETCVFAFVAVSLSCLQMTFLFTLTKSYFIEHRNVAN